MPSYREPSDPSPGTLHSDVRKAKQRGGGNRNPNPLPPVRPTGGRSTQGRRPPSR